MTSTLVSGETDQTTYLGAMSVEPSPQRLAAILPTPSAQTLCPFCGELKNDTAAPCPTCNTLDTTATRAAATQRSGLWFVHTNHSTSAGISFEAVCSLIHQHLLMPDSIVRGPASGQLYRLARSIRGLGREFGLCYSCGGDVDTSETVCPHCDRLQTLQEFPAQVPAPASPAPVFESVLESVSEQPRHSLASDAKDTACVHAHGQVVTPEREEFIPEVSGHAREALLGEPTIRVHSLSDHEDFTEEHEDFSVRPVIAERSERHIPKDDLLTPCELAKAFQLEFSMTPEDLDRPYRIAGKTTRQIKIVLAGTSALAIAFVMGMQVIRMFDPAPARSHGSQLASSTTPNTPRVQPNKNVIPAPDARLAADVAFATPMPVTKTVDKRPAKSVDKQLDKPAGTQLDKPAVAANIPTPPPVAVAIPTPIPRPNPSAIQAATPAPVLVKPAVAVVPPTLQPKVAKKPTVSQVMYVEPSPVQSNDDDPKVLLNAGLTAESNGNYGVAVKAYERIQSLPSTEWPANLLTRLELAKKELKGDLN
jgi:hypothetical protein